MLASPAGTTVPFTIEPSAGHAMVTSRCKGGWRSNFYPERQLCHPPRLARCGEGRVPNIVKGFGARAQSRDGGKNRQSYCWEASFMSVGTYVFNILVYIKFAPDFPLTVERHNKMNRISGVEMRPTLSPVFCT